MYRLATVFGLTAAPPPSPQGLSVAPEMSGASKSTRIFLSETVSGREKKHFLLAN